MVGRLANGETSIAADTLAFVCTIIDSGLKCKSERKCSFDDIFEILKQNNFQIAKDVDIAEVSSFVS
jgi:hypothetical protein